MNKGVYSNSIPDLNKRLASDATIDLNSHYDLNSIYVNEPGLYTIILGSKKPKGDALFDWVCRTVLPSL